MKFLEKDIKVAIFDLDGTLINSTSLWADIDEIFFHKRGMEIPPTYGIEIAHIGLTKAAELTVRKYLPNENPKDVINEWLELSFEAYRDNIPLKENAKDLLSLLSKSGVHIALATANSKEIYEVCLSRLGIYKYFELIVDVNSCKEGKNSPEIYDKVIEYFKVKREETLVFEDMLTPIKTAYKAGYNVVAVYDPVSTRDEPEAIKNSNLYVKSFKTAINSLKQYKFFGWENAFVDPVSENFSMITNPRELYDLLDTIWCQYTCAPRMRNDWSEVNKTLGQCSITAFLVQDIFGGRVYGVPLGDGQYHCFNVIDDVIFDLTSEQFGDEKLVYTLEHEQSREQHFSSEEKYNRYLYLKKELINKIS